MTRFPRPLAPATGSASPRRPAASATGCGRGSRLDRVAGERGFDVVVGECMADDGRRRRPRRQRAAELVAMLTDPAVAAVVPPWGGETAIDLLDQVDWDALAEAEPTWLVGWSDMCSVLLPLTLRLGLGDPARLEPRRHGVRRPRGTAALARPGRRDRRGDPDQPGPDPGRVGRLRAPTPRSPTMTLDRAGAWSVLGGGDAEMSGRAGRRLPRGRLTDGGHAVRRRAGVRPRARRRGTGRLPRGLRARRLRRRPAAARPAARRLVRARQRRPHRPHAAPRTPRR